MSPERRPYPTDLTDAEWAILEPLVLPPKSGGRPARERRGILDAIGYVVSTGCAWRYLPRDFPPRQTVYHYFRLWRPDGTWERIHDTLREQARQVAGRTARPSPGIVDSQFVKTTEKGGRGYDGGKKVNGRKRHLLVGATGLVLRVVVHAAELADSEGGKLVLDRITERYPELAPPLGRCRVHRRLRGVGSGGRGLSIEQVQKGSAWTERRQARSRLPAPPSRSCRGAGRWSGPSAGWDATAA